MYIKLSVNIVHCVWCEHGRVLSTYIRFNYNEKNVTTNKKINTKTTLHIILPLHLQRILNLSCILLVVSQKMHELALHMLPKLMESVEFSHKYSQLNSLMCLLNVCRSHEQIMIVLIRKTKTII